MLINKISNQRKIKIPIEKLCKFCEEEETSKEVWIILSVFEKKKDVNKEQDNME